MRFSKKDQYILHDKLNLKIWLIDIDIFSLSKWESVF